MTAIADVAAAIAAAGAPLLFTDTCSLLDIVRGQREGFGAAHAGAVIRILDLIEAGQITLVLPEQIQNELAANAADVKQGGTASIKALNQRIEQVHQVMVAFGGATPAPALPAPADYESLVDAVLARYLAAARTSDTTADAVQTASQRVITATAPAATGKQSYKDCLVLESCFETLAAARALGFTEPAYFMSSNVAEYADAGKKALHPQLVGDFAALGLEFARNYFELRYAPPIAAL